MEIEILLWNAKNKFNDYMKYHKKHVAIDNYKIDIYNQLMDMIENDNDTFQSMLDNDIVDIAKLFCEKENDICELTIFIEDLILNKYVQVSNKQRDMIKKIRMTRMVKSTNLCI
jgi:hypothetical protein